MLMTLDLPNSGLAWILTLTLAGWDFASTVSQAFSRSWDQRPPASRSIKAMPRSRFFFRRR